MGNCCSDECLKETYMLYNGYERVQPPTALKSANNNNNNHKTGVKQRTEKFQVMTSSDSFDDEFIQNGKEIN